jgi:sulfur transfer protein SufE
MGKKEQAAPKVRVIVNFVQVKQAWQRLRQAMQIARSQREMRDEQALTVRTLQDFQVEVFHRCA